VVAGGEGFADPPRSVIPPPGWHSRVVPWPAEGQKRFAVVLTCDPDAWRDGTTAPGLGASPLRCIDERGATRTLQPQDSCQFAIVLPDESAGLRDGRLKVVFGDGMVLEFPSRSGR